jgi:hypothetical protein
MNMEWLRSLVARSPKAAVAVGKTVFLLGAILVVSALFARAGYPSRLAPEGILGYAVAALLILAGMALVVLGGDVEKKDASRDRG